MKVMLTSHRIVVSRQERITIPRALRSPRAVSEICELETLDFPNDFHLDLIKLLLCSQTYFNSGQICIFTKIIIVDVDHSNFLL